MSQRHVPNTFVFKQLISFCKLEELVKKLEQAQITVLLRINLTENMFRTRSGTGSERVPNTIGTRSNLEAVVIVIRSATHWRSSLFPKV